MGKKWLVFCFLVLFLMNFVVADDAPITGEVITGEAITGEAVGGTGITVFLSSKPRSTIYRPENKTYLRYTQLINYTVVPTNANMTYSLDGAANVSVSNYDNITFTTGTHRFELWADNLGDVNVTTIYFTINTSKLVINYSEYNDSFKGESTDFYDWAYEDLLALNNTILEDTPYGKIEFWGTINVENDSDNTDRFVDLDTNTQIGANSIFLNSAALPNFNKASTLSIYGISFTDPEILRDGSVCSGAICTEISYGGGIYVFNVTGYSTYTLREKEVITVETPSSGGGGGGGSSSTEYVNIDIITPGIIEITENDDIIVPITFNNPDTQNFRGIKLTAKSSNYSITATFEESEITILEAGKNKTLNLFVTSDGAPPGNYEIEVTVESSNPSFTESETLYLKSVEIVGQAEVIERIILAQELFRENPECLELNDLLIRAQSFVDQGDIQSAISLVQEAIVRCRDLITNREKPSPPDFSKLKGWRTPIEIALILIIVTLAIFALMKRPNYNLRTDGSSVKRRSGGSKKGFFRRLFNGKGKKKNSSKKTAKKQRPVDSLDSV